MTQHKTVKVEDIEFRQTTIIPRVYVSKDGRYVIPEGNEPNKIRDPYKNYNKNGYPTQATVCNCISQEVDGYIYAKRIVVNMGRLVLDAWADQVNPELEVDHIDRNPFNNNLENLRLVTKLENAKNRAKTVRKNPTWLHTKEVHKKIMATRKAKIDGTYTAPVKEPKNVISFEEHTRARIAKREKKHNDWLVREQEKKIQNLTKRIAAKEEKLAELLENAEWTSKLTCREAVRIKNYKDTIEILKAKLETYNEQLNKLAMAA